MAPADAATTHSTASHCDQCNASPSRMKPIRAAIAGSRLIRMPNTRGGILRSASRSIVYGITDDSSATPSPATRTQGSSRAVPLSATPNGTAISAATAIPSARPLPSVVWRPSAAPTRM